MGLGEPAFTSFADGFSSAVVLVIGGDIADSFVQPDGVVVVLSVVELSGQCGRVGDRVQVGVLGFEMAEERLDPRLVVRCTRAAEVLSDPGCGHELGSVRRGHLGPIVRDRQ